MSDDKRDEPQDLRKELNQLWRTTLDQFDGLKDVLVRSSTAGKAKLDATLLSRQRDKLLAELGAKAVELHRKGEIELPESLASTIARIEELGAQIAEQESEAERLFRKDGAKSGEKRPSADPADEADER